MQSFDKRSGNVCKVWDVFWIHIHLFMGHIYIPMGGWGDSRRHTHTWLMRLAGFHLEGRRQCASYHAAKATFSGSKLDGAWAERRGGEVSEWVDQQTITMVSLHGGFLKWWYPQNTSKWSFLVGKPMVVGYHNLRKHPYLGKTDVTGPHPQMVG